MDLNSDSIHYNNRVLIEKTLKRKWSSQRFMEISKLWGLSGSLLKEVEEMVKKAEDRPAKLSRPFVDFLADKMSLRHYCDVLLLDVRVAARKWSIYNLINRNNSEEKRPALSGIGQEFVYAKLNYDWYIQSSDHASRDYIVVVLKRTGELDVVFTMVYLADTNRFALSFISTVTKKFAQRILSSLVKWLGGEDYAEYSKDVQLSLDEVFDLISPAPHHDYFSSSYETENVEPSEHSNKSQYQTIYCKFSGPFIGDPSNKNFDFGLKVYGREIRHSLKKFVDERAIDDRILEAVPQTNDDVSFFECSLSKEQEN